MIRANQPWKLAIGLSRALTAALAAGVFALVTPDIWQLGDALGWIRLSRGRVRRGDHGRADRRSWPVGTRVASGRSKAGGPLQPGYHGNGRAGVLSPCVALLLLALLTSPVLVPSQLFEEGLGHAVGVGDYMKLAWLTSSLATLGGARGGSGERRISSGRRVHVPAGSGEGAWMG